MLKHRKCLALLLLLSLLLCGCDAATQPPGSTNAIYDTAGRYVELPESIESICCVCPFTGQMLAMLGYADKITSTCNNITRSNMLDMMFPGVADITLAKGSGSVNAETILEKNTDIIFVNSGTWESDNEQAKLEALGIPCVVIGFENIAEQMEAIKVIGSALGEEAKLEAEQFVSWYQGVIDRVSTVCAAIPAEKKQRLYHAVNEAVRTDYAGSICTEWIAFTGVENVSVSGTSLSIQGDKAYTTLEQIYTWDPDLIICNEIAIDDYILSDEKWRGLRCVQEGKVYQMPVGISRMGHPTSSEIPLVLLWLAELLYPDDFDIDFREEVRQYYAEFFEYELSDEMIDAVINGDDMRTPKKQNSVE